MLALTPTFSHNTYNRYSSDNNAWSIYNYEYSDTVDSYWKLLKEVFPDVMLCKEAEIPPFDLAFLSPALAPDISTSIVL